MTINPKNILKLLITVFDQSQYDLESVISEEVISEKAFSFQIETLIKDAIQDSLLVETYTLTFDKNAIPESVSIEDEGDDFTIEKSVDFDATAVEKIDVEYKRKAVTYWKSGKKNKLKFESVQRCFKRLKSKR